MTTITVQAPNCHTFGKTVSNAHFWGMLTRETLKSLNALLYCKETPILKYYSKIPLQL